ncbi:MAG: hypothetical protein EBV82_08075, partial [Chitinophagia bacterium]|nr:hypothetical protein [Chitinophagia bacterium]
TASELQKDKEIEEKSKVLDAGCIKQILIDATKHKILKAPHPSPLSAHNGFFGCKHFSQANEYLVQQKMDPIDWKL